MSDYLVSGEIYGGALDRIAELESGGTAYDAGYQAAKADMDERVYRAEAALSERDRMLRCAYDRARASEGWQGVGAYPEWIVDIRAHAEEGNTA